jgi:hypothetical protein
MVTAIGLVSTVWTMSVSIAYQINADAFTSVATKFMCRTVAIKTVRLCKQITGKLSKILYDHQLWILIVEIHRPPNNYSSCVYVLILQRNRNIRYYFTIPKTTGLRSTGKRYPGQPRLRAVITRRQRDVTAKTIEKWYTMINVRKSWNRSDLWLKVCNHAW